MDDLVVFLSFEKCEDLAEILHWVNLSGVKVGMRTHDGIIVFSGLLSRKVRIGLMQLPWQLECWQGRNFILLGDLYAGVGRLTASL